MYSVDILCLDCGYHIAKKLSYSEVKSILGSTCENCGEYLMVDAQRVDK